MLQKNLDIIKYESIDYKDVSAETVDAKDT